MLFRYPGSKDKHIKYLAPHLENFDFSNGVLEPFAGTASVTFYLLANNKVPYYHINDIDEDIINVWKVIKKNPKQLISRIRTYQPNVTDFYKFKEGLSGNQVERALQKIVLHQTSFSGLGKMSGGPLGGKNQAGKYKIDSRWNPERLVRGIEECSRLLNSVPGDLTSLDWEQLLKMYEKKKIFIYLDPPYYKQGAQLYSEGTLDHKSLSEALQKRLNWLLSYDNHPEVKKMYIKSTIQELDVRSQIHHGVIQDIIISR
jgi:DNA adenine methylase